MEGKLINNQVFALIPSANPHTIFSSNRNEFTGDADGSIACYYSGNYIKTGQVTLTKFDGPNRIASGRFAFTLYEPGGCDSLKVTNGRFDVKF
jgi:flagellar basal body rod protein FlgG